MAPVISGLQVQCQAPADSSSSSLPIQRYRLSVTELEKVSMDSECGDHHTCVPLKPQWHTGLLVHSDLCK